MLEKLSSLLPSGRFTVAERERSLDELDAMKNDSAAMPTNPGAGSPPPDPMSHARDMLRSWITTANALQARTVFVALRAMALAYRDLPGRKTVVLFSEGFLHALDGRPEIDAVIDAANRSNVAFYVIDASGITQGGLDGKDPMSVRRRTYDNPLGPDLGEGRGGLVAGGLTGFDLGKHSGLTGVVIWVLLPGLPGDCSSRTRTTWRQLSIAWRKMPVNSIPWCTLHQT